MWLSILCLASLAGWLYLALAQGGFWRLAPKMDESPPASPPKARGGAAQWPEVVALIPARDEAAVLPESLPRLLAQRYPGALTTILIDDHSRDGTAGLAARLAAGAPEGRRLETRAAPDLPPGWTGKMWALETGRRAAAELAPAARYIWLSDADIAHDPDSLARLVARAEAENRDLVSLAPLLESGGLWGRLMIPSFVYFFALIYPFGWVADPRRRTAAAAGGCTLVSCDKLEEIGGFAAIGDRLIDDCALAAAVQRAGGRLFLSTTARSWSCRAYGGLAEIVAMIRRTAYTQLRHDPRHLIPAVLGLILLLLLPPVALASLPWHGGGLAAASAALAWALMAVTAIPVHRLYRLSPWRGLAMPAAGVIFIAATLASAADHLRGRGGQWKGRAQARP